MAKLEELSNGHERNVALLHNKIVNEVVLIKRALSNADRATALRHHQRKKALERQALKLGDLANSARMLHENCGMYSTVNETVKVMHKASQQFSVVQRDECMKQIEGVQEVLDIADDLMKEVGETVGEQDVGSLEDELAAYLTEEPLAEGGRPPHSGPEGAPEVTSPVPVSVQLPTEGNLGLLPDVPAASVRDLFQKQRVPQAPRGSRIQTPA